MRFPLRFFPNKPSLDFMGKKWVAFAFSIFISLAAIGTLAVKGLNFGIDFSGGIVMEVHRDTPLDLAELRSTLAAHGYADASLQDLGDANSAMIRLSGGEDHAAQAKPIAAVKALLTEQFGPSLEFRKVDYVGPKVGKELLRDGSLAALFAFLGIMLYLWFRFEWQYGLGALIALVHDAWMTIGFYSLTGLEFNLTSIAALLTIIGYSVNDSVVIYDRIRENLRRYKRMPMPELLNLSLNETLARTILTVTTTLLALVALALLGGETLKSFTHACLFGILIGTYSSIYVSAPVLIYMKLRAEPKPSAV